MYERLFDELVERHSARSRPMFISWLAIYYFLNPFLYVFSISQDKVFLNFGVQNWRFALLYCVMAPLLGYLLWTVRLRTHIVLYTFLIFEVIRGARHGYWDAVMLGIAILLVALHARMRNPFSAAGRHVHH